MSHRTCKLLSFLFRALKMILVGRVRHNQQGRTTRIAVFGRDVEQYVIVGHLLDPKNEEGVCVTKNFDAKLPMGCHNDLPKPFGVNNISDVDFDNTRLDSLCSVSLDYKKAIRRRYCAVLWSKDSG